MGGGAMFTPFSGTGRGLADPHIIPLPPTETSDLDANQPFSTIYSAPFKPCSTICTCHDQTCSKSLDSLCIIKDKSAKGSCCDSVFGPVPTQVEVEKAFSDLQRFMLGLSQSESGLNWLQLVLNRYQSRMLQSPGYRRIHDAFSMLRTEPSVQKMVLSLSCDKAVWEAIVKNEAVRNLQGSLSAAKEEESQSTTAESNIASLLLKWIMGITKSKILELIDKFGLLVSELFQPTEKEKPTSELDDLLEEKVRSSVLLSVVILMIVVVTRNHGA